MQDHKGRENSKIFRPRSPRSSGDPIEKTSIGVATTLRVCGGSASACSVPSRQLIHTLDVAPNLTKQLRFVKRRARPEFQQG